MDAQVLGFPITRRIDCGDAAAGDPACSTHDSQQWFDPARYERARVICDGCPCRRRCLTEALVSGETLGMWGGLTPAERAALPVAPVLELSTRR